MRKWIVMVVVGVLSATAFAAVATAGPKDCEENGTKVPGHCGRDGEVNSKWNSLYAYDADGDWYWDLGDGRVQGSVGSVEDLDQATLTVCTYQNVSRGDFGDDPFLDNGWIINSIRCSGYEEGHFTYLIVHESDPRYTGNPDWAIWGNWEYHVLTQSGVGNWVRP